MTTTPAVKELLTSSVVAVCYYVQRPQDRPFCQSLGVVRYGPTVLCDDCDRRRSAVGKGTTPVRLSDPGALLDVIAARDTYRQAELALHQAVRSARHASHPWSALGTVLGTTAKAPSNASITPPPPTPPPHPSANPALGPVR